MKTVNVHEAKTHLSRLLEAAERGESIVIARAGKPVARVIPYEEGTPREPRRLGFLAGEVEVPDDFDRMGRAEIEALFRGRK